MGKAKRRAQRAVTVPRTDVTFPGPRVACRTAQKLYAELHVKPVVTEVQPGLWRLVLENERVRLTIDYRRPRPQDRARWQSSTLTVDGRARPIAEGFSDFVRIWRAHPVRSAGPAEPVKLLDIPEMGEDEPLPEFVRTILDTFRRAGAGDQVAAGRTGGRWIIGMGDGGSGIRLVIARAGRAKIWSISWGRSQVVVDGQDVTAQAGGDIAKALALLDGKPKPGQPGDGPVAGTAPAATSNAVRERRHSVIRN
jgi:hypothetical protein